MYKNARDTYLENAVLSASPQQLRKMLIDGAIRFSRQAIEHWNQKKFDEGLRCIDKTRDILSEILTSTKQLDSETLRIRQIYVFLIQEVTEASLRNDVEKMQGVIDVLEVEQETWSLVLQQLSAGNAGQTPNQVSPAPPHSPPTPSSPANSTTGQNGGFSFEA